MIDLIIVGAGGFGREVYQWLTDWQGADRQRQIEFRIKGFLSNDADILNDFKLPVGILGDENNYQYQPNDRFVMGIGTTKRKTQVAKRMLRQGARFISLIHPTALISNSAKIGKGVVICPFVTICTNATVGNFAMMNIYSSAGHDAVIGDYSVLSPYATLNGHAVLEEGVFMGTHTTVVNNKTVGANSRISANSLVVQNIPPHKTMLGNPGKTIDNL